MLFVSFVSILLCFFSYLAPDYYLSELVLSFTPYVIVWSFLLFIVHWILFRKKRRSNYRTLYALCALCFWGIFFAYSKLFTWFYSWEGFSPAPEGSQEMSVLYANIKYNNYNYTWLETLVTTYNPDVVLFVEFSDEHSEHLKSFFMEHYPYINRTTRSKRFVWSIVFSKYPVENLADDFEQWAWRYGYFSITKDNEPYYFYLVHTSSPVTYKNYLMRNDHLNTLISDFKLHDDHRKNNKLILLWDFNTSPWSLYYRTFVASIGTGMDNITRYFPLLFTWKVVYFPLLWSHIDHIFATSEVIFSAVTPLTVVWSDHLGFFLKIVQ